MTQRRVGRFYGWALASAFVATAGGGMAVGCSGDDTASASGEDGAVDSASSTDANDFIDSHFPTDSGKTDSGAADAHDGAAVCTSVPDAAIYGLDAIDAGATTVSARSCKGCHTADLSGNATTTVGGQYPRNLTPDIATGLGCWTDEQIARAVLFGIDDQGVHLCVMPQFESTIGDGGITDVIAYLRSLPPVSKDVPDGLCPADAGVDAD